LYPKGRTGVTKPINGNIPFFEGRGNNDLMPKGNKEGSESGSIKKTVPKPIHIGKSSEAIFK